MGNSVDGSGRNRSQMVRVCKAAGLTMFSMDATPMSSGTVPVQGQGTSGPPQSCCSSPIAACRGSACQAVRDWGLKAAPGGGQRPLRASSGFWERATESKNLWGRSAEHWAGRQPLGVN